MDENKSIDLKSLVGKHFLSGVDESNVKIKQYNDEFEDCQCINFVLDGTTYTAVEDPEDGYRSTLKEVFASKEKVTNNFYPVEVLIIHRDSNRISSHFLSDCDILEFIDTKNGKCVLEIGTDNYDNYYPQFVASWTPENLSANN